MEYSEIQKILAVLINMIRIGRVNSVNETNGTVRVLFDDKDNVVSYELPLLSFEYNMPKVKEQVLCIFLPNGIQQGFCLGPFFSSVNPPPVQDKDIYRKMFDANTWIEYNEETKELNIQAPGGINILGSISVRGNINATGTIMDAGGNSNHHSH